MKKRSFSKKKLLLLGSGELGKELVIEAQRLGCEIIALDKYPNAPAMQVADKSFVIDMSDKSELKKIIKELKPDFVIPEIESLSIEALKDMEKEGVKIIPNARTVELTMNRDKIRDLVSSELNIKTAKYAYVFNKKHLKKKALEINYPLIIKPLMSSSGKGQNIVENENLIFDAWNKALKDSRGNVQGVILEEFIKFNFEFTLLSIRTNDSKNIFCMPIGHEQKGGDYQSSWQPLNISPKIIEQAQIIACKILNELDGAGIYGVEFFVVGEDLIFSELSPRPHDTGMVTILSQNLNQFELHIRAILELPIPKISILHPAASRVILSKGIYRSFSYDGIDDALEIENSKILIFGKPIARLGRRMGVALAIGKDVNEARLRADECASKIKITPFSL